MSKVIKILSIIALVCIPSAIVSSVAQESTPPQKVDENQSASIQARDFSEPFCFKSKNIDEAASFEYDLVLNLYQKSFIDPKHSESLWNQNYLTSRPHVLIALKEFLAGKRGMALKNISFYRKTPSEIHDAIIKEGFTWKIVPLRASLKKQTYWMNDGSTTRDPKHPDVVNMYIYIHKDGSIIRMKPKGIPDVRGKHPRRSAHVVKAVLQDLDPNLCQKEVCHYDSSYQNEAFKVTRDHRPVPKAPSPKYGLKLPFDNASHEGRKLNRIVKNIVMNLVYENLQTACPLPAMSSKFH